MLRAKRLVLVAHKTGGTGLRLLANRLTEKVGYRVYRVTPNRVRGRVIGHQFLPGLDKIAQLTRFRDGGVSSPPFVVRSADVDSLGTKRVVARRLINASEGRGITVFGRGEQPPPAPLYVGYITKKKEFRVHVLDNQVIDVAEKRKRRGFEQERDSFVRNVANGYVFCRSGVVEPLDLRPLALSAVAALGDYAVINGRSQWQPRSYGAVDVIYNEKQNKCFVLEVNSRPGMCGTTVEAYANAILTRHSGTILRKTQA